MTARVRVGLVLFLAAAAATFPSPAAAEDGRMPQGGLLGYVGFGSGQRAMGFVARGNWLVHGLEKDERKVEKARKLIRFRGLVSLVSVDEWPGERLPYADNTVNLLMVDDPGSLNKQEVLRVLVPDGVAKFKGETIRKPRPEAMDSWGHPRHGADGNPVSRDAQVDVSRRIRWIGNVQGWGRPLASDGRYYKVQDYTRDAFNGLPLWKERLDPRAAGDGFVFGLAGNNVVGLDAGTGARVGSFGSADQKSGTILLAEGNLVVADRGEVRVYDMKTGKPRWSAKVSAPRCVVAGNGRLFLVDGDPKRGESSVAICVDLATGEEQWRMPPPKATDANPPRGGGRPRPPGPVPDVSWLAGTTECSLGGDVLAYEVSPFADGAECAIHVLSAADGQYLWSHKYAPPMGHGNQARAFFINGGLWIHSSGFTLLDRLTGKKGRTISGGGGHCYPAIATIRYLMHGEMNFSSVETGQQVANPITKGSCQSNPFIPANGLLYTIRKHCGCWPMIQGYVALAPDPPGHDPRRAVWSAKDAFSKGAAYGLRPQEDSDRGGADEDAEWPMYRHDRYRSSYTKTPVPPRPGRLWAQQLGLGPPGGGSEAIRQEWPGNPYVQGPITAPTVAGGRVFVAVPHAHEVVALSARTGKGLWSFAADGIIDTPPTAHRGYCLFGTRSGWVYCLLAANGELVWRERASPEARLIVAWGHMESAWPLPGSVLAQAGVAYVAAGRSPLADGGIQVSAIAVRSGKVLARQVIDTFDISSYYQRGMGVDNDPADIMFFDGPGSPGMSRARLGAKGVAVRREAHAYYQPAVAGEGRPVGWAPVGIWSYGPTLFYGKRGVKRPLWVTDGETIYGPNGHQIEGPDPNGGGLHAFVLPKDHPPGGGRLWTAYSYFGGLRKRWSAGVPAHRAIVIAGETLFTIDKSGQLNAYSTTSGQKVGSAAVGGTPVWDGMAAAYSRLYVSMEDGNVVCLGDPSGKVQPPAPTPAPSGTSRRLSSVPEGPPEGPEEEAAPAAEAAQDGQEKADASPEAGGNASEASVRQWDARLLSGVRAKLAAGERPAFSASFVQGRAVVLSADEKGSLSIRTGPMELGIPWSRLTLADRKSLALSVAGDDEKGHAIAAFYLLATGNRSEAAEHLRKAGANAEAVRSAFGD